MQDLIRQSLHTYRQLNKDALPALQAGQALTHAENDEQAVVAYLLARQFKKSSQQNLERDFRKLKLFMREQGIDRFAQMSVEFCALFQQWLANPPEALILKKGKKKVPFYLDNAQINPEWRPFVAALSQAAIRRCVSNLQALFNWLVNVDYLQRNPWLAVKAVKVHNQHNLLQRHFLCLSFNL